MGTVIPGAGGGSGDRDLIIPFEDLFTFGSPTDDGHSGYMNQLRFKGANAVLNFCRLFVERIDNYKRLEFVYGPNYTVPSTRIDNGNRHLLYYLWCSTVNAGYLKSLLQYIIDSGTNITNNGISFYPAGNNTGDSRMNMGQLYFYYIYGSQTEPFIFFTTYKYYQNGTICTDPTGILGRLDVYGY